ncbi:MULTISPECIES: hypothetical protein [Ramlibacter]|uniref:hypothetical protein n=1 Tax=Ramlibacter TaxID=174951 RepID=UPI002AB00B0E|nr:hypothetical protein [Ramlibacter aquaticus]
MTSRIRILSLLLALPAVALAQQATAPAQPASAARHAAPHATAKSTHSKSRSTLHPAARKAVEEATPIEDDPDMILTDEEKALAREVFVGEMPCELGAKVRIRPGRREGIFVVTTKNYRFIMHPVASRTHAVRLEDPRRGAMWLQLGNKSMLMSQKLGQRLADECQSPEQITFADALKKHPQPSILDPLPAASATATATAATANTPAPAPAAPASAGAPAAAASAAPPSTPSKAP